MGINDRFVIYLFCILYLSFLEVLFINTFYWTRLKHKKFLSFYKFSVGLLPENKGNHYSYDYK